MFEQHSTPNQPRHDRGRRALALTFAGLGVTSAGHLAGASAASATTYLVPTGCGVYSGSPVPAGYNLIGPTTFTAGTGSNDFIIGTGGGDTLSGGGGNDIICGLSGVDFLYGGAGQDIIHGGKMVDTMYGEADGDALYGELGDDVMYGDSMTSPLASDGADFLFGGNGEDTLDGQGQPAGAVDTADGGPKSDTCLNDEVTTTC